MSVRIEVATTECAKCNVDVYCDAKNTYNVCGFEPCPSGTFSDEYGKSSIASCPRLYQLLLAVVVMIVAHKMTMRTVHLKQAKMEVTILMTTIPRAKASINRIHQMKNR